MAFQLNIFLTFMNGNQTEKYGLIAFNGRYGADSLGCGRCINRRFLITTSAANRLIGEVVQSQRRPLLGPSLG